MVRPWAFGFARSPTASLARRRSVHRRENSVKPLLQLEAPVRAGMREHVKFVLADCGKNLGSYFGWFEPRPSKFSEVCG